jgi:hypothetical protein
MNTSLFRSTLLALAALALPYTASAMLLVGWHDFDATSDDESSEPGSTAVDFSGNLNKNSPSQGLGGDNGGGSGIFYGNSNLASGSGDDGTVRVPTGGTGATFSMTNSSGSAVSLDTLFFDATESSTITVLTVAYRIGVAGAFTTLASYNTLNPTGDSSNITDLQANFSDLSISLLAIPSLLDTQTIQFRFTVGGSGQGARLDNIAITAIPEPASLIALACVLGSGLFLRQRPRQFAPSLA